MKCPECGQKHLKKYSVLKVIHAVEPWKMVQDYMAVMVEIGASMRNDAKHQRKGAFITRVRDYKECYFKGLWVGLMATPEEIVHDASGEKPWLALPKLARHVSAAIFEDEKNKLSLPHIAQRKTRFDAMDILSTSMHFTPLFLLQWGLMSDAEARRMYDSVLKSVEIEATHLKFVSGALKANKKRKDILEALRQLLKKKGTAEKQKAG